MNVQGAFARACCKEVAARRYEVADIEQPNSLVCLFSQIVDTEKDLHTPGAIFDLRECGLAHVAHQAQASGYGKVSAFALPFVKMFKHFRDSMCALYVVGVGIDALFPHGV